MSEGLLRTKLFAPPARPHQIRRQRLLDKLNAGLQAGIPFTLISTPAGFGKTTLIGDWLRNNGHPVAWLALDEGDNDPIRFWRYVDAALQSVDDRLGESLRPALFSMQPPAIQQIITGLINDVVKSWLGVDTGIGRLSYS